MNGWEPSLAEVAWWTFKAVTAVGVVGVAALLFLGWTGRKWNQ